MSDSDKQAPDSETILIALDQISQTIDVMSSVVARLRNHIQAQEAAAGDSSKDLREDMQSDRVLH
tara:strand:+ start:26778 stop:26972 length:195 start_codon:yes stop_codon:yes gene_type:complete